jgi:hypothetical protein
MIVERSLSDTEIDALLTSEMFCHLACSEGGKPYVVPMAYVFHKNTIYGQTTEGKKALDEFLAGKREMPIITAVAQCLLVKCS